LNLMPDELGIAWRELSLDEFKIALFDLVGEAVRGGSIAPARYIRMNGVCGKFGSVVVEGRRPAP